MGKCLHLVLNFLEDRCGRRRHAVEILDVHFVEFVTDVFLNSLYKVVQVFHVIHCTFALTRSIGLILDLVSRLLD
jgi:hypothetical protein